MRGIERRLARLEGLQPQRPRWQVPILETYDPDSPEHQARLQRLETQVSEAEMRCWVEEAAAEHGLNVDALIREARRINARLELLKKTHPLPLVKGKVDMEPHIRILAQEEGLSPEEVDELVEQIRRAEEGRSNGTQN